MNKLSATSKNIQKLERTYSSNYKNSYNKKRQLLMKFKDLVKKMPIMMNNMSPNNLVKIQLGSERESKNTFDLNSAASNENQIHIETFPKSFSNIQSQRIESLSKTQSNFMNNLFDSNSVKTNVSSSNVKNKSSW